jgi:hypothetical protein
MPSTVYSLHNQLKSDCDNTTKPLELYEEGVKRTHRNQVPGAPLPWPGISHSITAVP